MRRNARRSCLGHLGCAPGGTRTSHSQSRSTRAGVSTSVSHPGPSVTSLPVSANMTPEQHQADAFRGRTQIALTSDRDGDFEIYTIRTDRTDLRQPTVMVAGSRMPGNLGPRGAIQASKNCRGHLALSSRIRLLGGGGEWGVCARPRRSISVGDGPVKATTIEKRLCLRCPAGRAPRCRARPSSRSS